MNSNRIETLQSADSTDDAMPKTDIQDTYVDEAGDTMTGDLALNGHDLVNVDALGNGTGRTIQLDSDGNVYIDNGILSLATGLDSGNITSNAITGAELADTGNFNVNSIDTATALDAGNLSLGSGMFQDKLSVDEIEELNHVIAKRLSIPSGNG